MVFLPQVDTRFPSHMFTYSTYSIANAHFNTHACVHRLYMCVCACVCVRECVYQLCVCVCLLTCTYASQLSSYTALTVVFIKASQPHTELDTYPHKQNPCTHTHTYTYYIYTYLCNNHFLGQSPALKYYTVVGS